MRIEFENLVLRISIRKFSSIFLENKSLYKTYYKMSIRLGGKLKELRIHLCQTSKQSAGVRDFINNNYVNIKKENPNFPILIRECNGIMPRVWARYEKGVEQSTSLTNLAANDVLSTIKQLVK